MEEIWKIWPKNSNYEVSNTGKIRSIPRWVKAGAYGGKRWVEGKIVGTLDSNGYKTFTPYTKYKNGKNIIRKYLQHRVIAETWIPNPNNLSDVNHKNGIKNDNRVENLEWVSKYDNYQHARHVLGHTKHFSLKQLRELYNTNPNITLGEFMDILESRV